MGEVLAFVGDFAEEEVAFLVVGGYGELDVLMEDLALGVEF